MDENEFKKLDVSNQRWKIYQLLSKKSKEVVAKELEHEHKWEYSKGRDRCECGAEKATSEHVSGVNLGATIMTEETTINFETIYEGRTYKGKWKICRYKCGGLVSWPTDYKKGDKTLHIHPKDWEVLGFAEEGINGTFHCPVVKKK